MTQLAFSTDFVQLPADSTGKKSAFLLAAVSGGSLYVPAGVVVGVTGQVAEVLSAAPGASDNGLVVRLAGNAVVQGDVASEDPDSGNPVKVGGKYNSTLPTFTSGDRADLQLTNKGLLRTRSVIAFGPPGTGGDAKSEYKWVADEDSNTTNPLPVDIYAFSGSAFDRLRTVDAFKTASATPDVGLLGTSHPDRRFTAVSLGTAANSTQTWDCNGASEMLVHVGTSTTGTFTFEVSADGTNWVAAEVRETLPDIWRSGQNFTPAANTIYKVITSGYRSVRARTVTTLGATVSLTATLSAITPVVTAIDTGPAPHAIGYAITSKTAQYTTAQTGAALWTPASGKKLVIISYQIQVGGTTAGTMQLWFGASADTTYTRGTDLAIFDGEFAPSATNKPGVVQSGVWLASAVDHVLRVTTSAAINPITVTVWGYEI